MAILVGFTLAQSPSQSLAKSPTQAPTPKASALSPILVRSRRGHVDPRRWRVIRFRSNFVPITFAIHNSVVPLMRSGVLVLSIDLGEGLDKIGGGLLKSSVSRALLTPSMQLDRSTMASIRWRVELTLD
jgi:hypothetical protein